MRGRKPKATKIHKAARHVQRDAPRPQPLAFRKSPEWRFDRPAGLVHSLAARRLALRRRERTARSVAAARSRSVAGLGSVPKIARAKPRSRKLASIW